MKDGSTQAAVEAYRRGFVPIPIRGGDKRPYGAAWTQRTWSSEDEVRSAFTGWATDGITNVGLLLGDRGGGLVDVDLDHAESLRLGPILLPKTAMMSGRRGRPKSHYWYVIDGEVPATRRYKMPDMPESAEKRVAVEIRSTAAQTLIPPSIHPSGEPYEWHGDAWGGAKGPTRVDGKTLGRQVGVLGMLAVLLEKWPKEGGRHDAYLALAGGLLRYGEGVHPYWEKNLGSIIQVIAAVTRDRDGGSTRVAEVVPSTIERLRKQDENRHVVGFGRLAEIIGNEHAELVRRMARTVEDLSDHKPEPMRREHSPGSVPPPVGPNTVVSGLEPEIRNPMEERVSSWDRVDMEPYILGQVVMPQPDVLIREDGKGLMYPGRVNSLYGLSESGKSWVALAACQQEMAKGDRVMYLDFEDSPEGMWERLRLIGVGADDMLQFAYVHPEDPISDMLRGRFSPRPDDPHHDRSRVFKALLDSFDPTLVVVDGMTTLYNSHGLDTNAAGDTDVIASWLKSLARNGRTTVIVIDHTGKGGHAGSSPIGAHHKIAMVQGTAIQVNPVSQPMPGHLGELDLLIYKDRPGAVRVVSGPIRPGSRTQLAAKAYIDSTEPGLTRITLKVPDYTQIEVGDEESIDRAAKRAERERKRMEWETEVRAASAEVLTSVFGGVLDTWMTKAAICKALPDIEAKVVTAAIDQMRHDGTLIQKGATRGTRYALKGSDSDGE